ncbi:MAG: MFS transporter, partial [Flammeovirgaceae bacterium]
LISLRSFGSIENESYKKHNQSNQNFSNWLERITANSHRKIVILGFIFALANQFSGINAIIFYANQVFLHITKDNKDTANLYTVCLGVLQVIVTFISGFLINRFGRRTLMMVG